MEARLEQVLPSFYERVRRWVAQGIAATKDGLNANLLAWALPADPAVLEKQGAAASEAARKNFSAQLHAFSLLERSVQLGRAVRMPDFTPDPVTQLTADLKALLAARTLENERAVQHFFKVAVAAAADAAKREVEAVAGSLASKARMKE